ncbi:MULTISPECIES: SDR family oxidoreductase [Acetobacter]|jgi:NAD(P)-dependent dehydrogenase (short-subunit alcohol dehydrogenase family)|uniref:NAD(P)-dependent dehydrogenase (Short-subunit alcohol dehydrogenase family) n=1 Tax=Acetobacter lovaniensis TaxID=104100 RepID=A0A841QJM8_9PROT|nr:SDR family oxidoreductase [Acetobacter lovaniensis]MBB6458648.1 NAD(P)-dependent dehydrogenase (short-subunit alcohol dehydrogenase family) [Acetobacter lovaniensis]MCP1240862.1 SDR family oxidoreductase [Acetobacter lovaniensis]NHN82874.1 SDR family oxidoreductase [Acetobacter lovaniensis]GBQ70616.1 short-chain dehydrogenase [Acetobacter lovaniensis NRIC 0474]
MDIGLRGKVAVVTGGSSGIGLATARELLNEGMAVAICGRDPARLEDARVYLAEYGDVLARQCDILDKAAVLAFRDAVLVWRGSCDLLVNNAGQGRVSTFSDTTDNAWHEELNLKFFSQINTIRAFEEMLRASGQGAIVAVNSLLAYQPEPHMVCTSAARAGVQNLLKSLAGEFAPVIRVNSVVVGLIESGQWDRRFAAREDKLIGRDEWFSDLARKKHIPMERLGFPTEVARAIAFLGSPAASFTTGAQIEVSGGLSRHI